MARTKTISYDRRIKIFWALFSISLISIALYIFAINSTVRYTVTRQHLERELVRLNSDNGALEFEYLELKNSITKELAYTKGYKEVTEPVYASRGRASTLTLNR